MSFMLVLQSLARQALRRLPTSVDDPSLDDRVRLLESELAKTRGAIHHHRETIIQMIEAGGACCCRPPYVCADEAVDAVARHREPWTVIEGHVPAIDS